MTKKADLTQEKIIESARQEFLRAGFHKASMRTIAAEAEVTTGAIYRYFTDKNDLFCAATKAATAALDQMYGGMADQALGEIEIGNTYNQGRSMENLAELFEVVYAYFDQFYLLIMCSDGAGQESFLDRIVEVETRCTLEYLEKLKQQRGSSYEIDQVGLHIIIEAYVSALLEPVRHRMTKAEAMEHITFIGNFFTDGWAGFEERIK